MQLFNTALQRIFKKKLKQKQGDTVYFSYTSFHLEKQASLVRLSLNLEEITKELYSRYSVQMPMIVCLFSIRNKIRIPTVNLY